jgi:DDE family transposase
MSPVSPPPAVPAPAVTPPAPALADVEAFLCDAIGRLAPEVPGPRGPGRPRVLPALLLWTGLLVCVLQGFTSHLALWRLLTARDFWRFPRVALSDQALYHRLARDGTAPLERLFRQLSALLAERLAPYAATHLAPFASGVYALDQMVLDRVARLLPALRALPAGAAALLPGQLAGLFDLRRQQWARVEYLPDPQQNEKVAARALVADLPVGSLILADLGYFGFQWFDELTDAAYWWVSRLRGKTSYTVLHAFYQRGDTLDALVWLGTHRADRAKHAVRLVQFLHHGVLHRYVTNVLDPTVLPVADLARLYARRWDIELAFNLVKTHLGLHLLWGSKPVVVLQQVWAVFTIAQVFQALRLEIAGRAGVDPYEVSLPLLVEYLPFLAARGLDPVQVIVEQGRALRLIRPSSRTVIAAPAIPPEDLCPRPPALVLTRPPRYSQRRCGPRPTAAAS